MIQKNPMDDLTWLYWIGIINLSLGLTFERTEPEKNIVIKDVYFKKLTENGYNF